MPSATLSVLKVSDDGLSLFTSFTRSSESFPDWLYSEKVHFHNSLPGKLQPARNKRDYHHGFRFFIKIVALSSAIVVGKYVLLPFVQITCHRRCRCRIKILPTVTTLWLIPSPSSLSSSLLSERFLFFILARFVL